jgi:hypothetical protein
MWIQGSSSSNGLAAKEEDAARLALIQALPGIDSIFQAVVHLRPPHFALSIS